MAPEISTIVFKVYTPIKRKFKPLKDKNPTPEPLNAYNNRGIHSENDSEWPPLSSPQSSLLSFKFGINRLPCLELINIMKFRLKKSTYFHDKLKPRMENLI